MEKLIWRCFFDYAIHKNESAGISISSGVLSLGKIYKQPLTYIIYYGQLQYSGISDYSIYDMIIANDTSSTTEVEKCRLAGCKVIQYKAFGSVFEDSETWLSTFKTTIKGYKDDGYADGIFFDECEVGYWDLSYYTQEDKCAIFQNALQELCDYCRDIGLITVVNGVRAFAQVGDYWLWESFSGYWNTNKLNYTSDGDDSRTENSDGTKTYNMNFDDWILTGDLAIVGSQITGSTGNMTIQIKPEDILVVGDQLDSYDWVYFEWFGEGANDSTCEIYASYGDVWPKDGTWTTLPKLYSGSPAVWNGININAKYIEIELQFTGASLELDSCFIAFGYVYPYYNMTNSNGAADTNPQYWNYNNAQLAYILDKSSRYYNNPNENMPCRVLAHCYGEVADETKTEYMFCLANMFEFSGWDYTHPLHQFIKYTDILDNPFGMLLSRTDNEDGSYSATFTGCSLAIDTANNTHVLTRTEPSYWYDRAITCDGTMTDWAAIAKAYENSNTATLHLYKLGFYTDFSGGTHNNTEDGGGYLNLVVDGSGDWTSPELSVSRVSKMVIAYWNGYSSGVTFEVRYKTEGGSYGSWNSYTIDTNNEIDEEFDYCQIKVTLTGTRGTNTCWGYALYYKPELLEPLNLRDVKITDDQAYLYIYAKFNDVIDFDTHVYNIYFYTEDTADFGFIGDWWETSYGVHYYIYNTSLYRWDDNSDRTDTAGFTYLGHIFDYEFSTDGKEIEYRIKKSILGYLSVDEIKIYMLLIEATTNYTALIQPSGVDSSVSPVTFDGEMLYTQTQYDNYCPHGYYKSEEVYINQDNDGVRIEFDTTEPANTSVNVYLRYKKYNENWSSWVEISDSDEVKFKVQAIQYCIALHTTDKTVTPSCDSFEITIL